MHPGASHQQGDRLWLVGGTGEGPPLALALEERGWTVRVFVVSAAAALAYPASQGLEVAVGPLGDADNLMVQLQRARATAVAPRWVIDATHPFAQRISADLGRACEALQQPLLRLVRPLLQAEGATLLPRLASLGAVPLQDRALLLAIGARQLRLAMDLSPGARHHCRILPSAGALAEAMAAGLRPERVACLRPGTGAAIERALCRRWGIEAVLCRRSGGPTETHWQRLASEAQLHLLLLDRPAEPPGVEGLGWLELLERIGLP
jgi:precorrin-6A/cobalt-precorrin-6A reductase